MNALQEVNSLHQCALSETLRRKLRAARELFIIVYRAVYSAWLSALFNDNLELFLGGLLYLGCLHDLVFYLIFYFLQSGGFL